MIIANPNNAKKPHATVDVVTGTGDIVEQLALHDGKNGNILTMVTTLPAR